MGWTAINKTSLFTDVLILYIENTKESPKKVLEHKFQFKFKFKFKVTNYMVNVKKSIVFLYGNDEKLEIGKKEPFTVAHKIHEILRYKSNKIYGKSIC